ncbi:hypothetical protein AMYX_42700 [Anaeromyxobacter diazotrophicus]|uniref:Uncharacterized protein n=1 Tax=Anaeromyxobacter diazotrophicus TaxID=2590199 RepID=A0A7I9VTR0_9BACT|nr:hypothetical protein AMYX_42700 [Anaeromyxobacter diazotrophicus]
MREPVTTISSPNCLPARLPAPGAATVSSAGEGCTTSAAGGWAASPGWLLGATCDGGTAGAGVGAFGSIVPELGGLAGVLGDDGAGAAWFGSWAKAAPEVPTSAPAATAAAMSLRLSDIAPPQ